VKTLDQRAAPPKASDPDLRQARERLAAQDPADAARLARHALDRDPQSVAALQTLAEALLALGDAKQARDRLAQALRIDDRNPRSRALLGDAFLALGDRYSAEDAYRVSLRLRPDPEIQRKVQELGLPPAPNAPSASSPPHPPLDTPFRLRFDGSVNEAVGSAVLRLLSDAYAEYARRFAFSPEAPVDVTLQGSKAIADRRAPEWADGLNADGAIQVPVVGLDKDTPRLQRVLRHELAHTFLTARTGNNCPTWLQEGVAQWLEGSDPERNDSALAALARAQKLPGLITLEGPFNALPEAQADVAYQASLSAVAYIVRKRGEVGVVRLISALGDRLPSEEALPVALALSYPELQSGWEDYLRTLDKKSSPGPRPTR
jgi:tetratricopeptide (TPR) repeat protein